MRVRPFRGNGVIGNGAIGNGVIVYVNDVRREETERSHF